jgi:hypothetical protein
VADFIARHPHWRLQRRDSGPLDANRPVTSIECAFLLDELRLYRGNGEISADYSVISDRKLAGTEPWRAELYVSADNARYERLGTEPVIKREVRRIRVADPNNFTLIKSARCLVITLSGFRISAPFLAVDFYGGGHRLLLIPYSMVKAKSGRRLLATTISPTFRYQPSLTKEFKRHSPVPGDFRTCGFEFAEMCVTGWRDWPTFGLARGHEPYGRGCLCEAVPGVRRYWLERVRTLFDYGFDGVDIRLFSHCSGVPDYVNYGYNREILAEFRRRYGRDPGQGKHDFMKIMRVRGEFFLRFLEAAKKLAKRRRKAFQVHLRNCMCRPSFGALYHENGFWAMPKILPDWKRIVELSDAVIIGDNLCAHHFRGDKRRVALPIKRYAAKLGKEVWAYCFLQQGHSFNRPFLEDLAKDPHVHGLHLYEVVYNQREDDGIVEVISPVQVRIVPKHQALFDELLKP